MRELKLSEIASAAGGTLLCGDGDKTVGSVVTDSRAIVKGCLFVPIIGEHFDGHDFISAALTGGAAAALTARDMEPSAAGALIRVGDTREALLALARYYRELFSPRVVGLTGSVGKTTTRNMTADVISRRFKTLRTLKNYNNEIGLPQTVFELDSSYEAAVLEMGMSGFGEIDRLAAVVQPELAMITNIGMSHIELLGSRENIYLAKSEILRHVKPGGAVIINGDDAILRRHMDEMGPKVYRVGLGADCDATATDIKTGAESVEFQFAGLGRSFPVKLNVPGRHNVYNALFAITAGILFGVEDGDITAALADFVPPDGRQEVIRVKDFTILNDTYNAAPDSIEAALDVLSDKSGKKIAVLGDVACLGEYSGNAHLSVGTSVARHGVDELFTVGEEARRIAQGAYEAGMDSGRIHSFDDVPELFAPLASALEPGCFVLVKASRVMRLERVTDFLKRL